MNWLKFWSRIVYALIAVNVLFSIFTFGLHASLGWLLALIMAILVYSREGKVGKDA